ncbi:MAG: carbonic anhydrase [Pseudomonadota bacterium]
MADYSSLPETLIQRYRGWHATQFQDSRARAAQLVTDGQHPSAMVISCCDSRINVLSMFGADMGEFFVHRNVANLVPPYEPTGKYQGTCAALEYAVTALQVASIIILGHSQCGGVKGCYDMCSSSDGGAAHEDSFVEQWVDILRPGYETVAKNSETDPLTALEHQGIRLSLENLMTFPFVRERVEAGTLTLHGLWYDLRSGTLEMLNPTTDKFELLT